MSKFKVHVQHISYGWCGLELVISDKLIKCNAGYTGPNPLASLIEICLDFLTSPKEGYEDNSYIEKAKTTWQEEPGDITLELELSKSNRVLVNIKKRDDDKNVLEEWHEIVSFEDFKDAIVSEGFRVLNAFGLFGYYAAWMNRVDFPLAALLRLTGKLELNWNGDYCSTDLSKEIECLSSYINP